MVYRSEVIRLYLCLNLLFPLIEIHIRTNVLPLHYKELSKLSLDQNFPSIQCCVNTYTHTHTQTKLRVHWYSIVNSKQRQKYNSASSDLFLRRTSIQLTKRTEWRHYSVLVKLLASFRQVESCTAPFLRHQAQLSGDIPVTRRSCKPEKKSTWNKDDTLNEMI